MTTRTAGRAPAESATMDEAAPTWLADALREMKAQAAAQIVTPKIQEAPGGRAGEFLLITPTPAGAPPAVTVWHAPPGRHLETLANADELVEFVKATKRDPSRAAVFVSAENLQYIYDIEDRRDRAAVLLEPSTAWTWLQTPRAPMKHREFLRVLRITLAGTLPAGSPIVEMFARLRFTANGQTTAEYTAQRAGLSRNTMAEVYGIGDESGPKLPETVRLSVQPFTNSPHRATIDCAIELTPETESFELIPYPQQMADGLADVLERIKRSIEQGADVPTYLGAP